MLKITCPFCGERNESEFIHGGALKPRRSDTPQAFDDNRWIDYLTVPPNPIGPLDERWWHVRGCGLWFTIRRNTLTHRIETSGDEPA